VDQKQFPKSSFYCGSTIPRRNFCLEMADRLESRIESSVVSLSLETLIVRIESRLNELGITLPPAPAPGGVYTPVVVVDHIAYVSGQVPYRPDGKLVIGRVGSDLTEEQGAAAARTVALAMLATIKASLGNLDRVKRIVKVLGFVNCTPEFQKHPAVMNGFSNTMVEVFGDAGKAARSAVGMGSLPFNVPVEVEAVLELHP
jgi:enamine deaminase RidA (YjgF/YER057c/UK114 family)